MRLHMSPTSPFARKVRIAVIELGFEDRVEIVWVDPWTEEGLRAINPMCQVPVLEDDLGLPLYDSTLMALMLDERSGGGLLPASGAARLAALRGYGVADGLIGATVRSVIEQRRSDGTRSEAAMGRQMAAVEASLARLDGMVGGVGEMPRLDAITLGVALDYLAFRHPERAWWERFAALGAWLGAVSERDSFCRTSPREFAKG